MAKAIAKAYVLIYNNYIIYNPKQNTHTSTDRVSNGNALPKI